jgi:hypothetical protein
VPERSAPLADANVWQFGSYWNVHAKHPISKGWIRITGIKTHGQAIADADAACLTLDREYEAAR